MLYTNCNILSMSRNDFENGFILTENGMIKAVGDMRQLPGYDRGVNLRGRTVIPAFVDAHCHLGIDVYKRQPLYSFRFLSALRPKCSSNPSWDVMI